MQAWPTFDPQQLVAELLELPVQIMGKVRGRITVPADADDAHVEQCALQDEQISQLLENLTVRKVIVVQKKIVNIVAS